MKKSGKRAVLKSMIIAFALMVSCSVAMVGVAFAEEGGVVLEVYLDGETQPVKSFTMSELEALMDDDEYNYSTCNSNPTIGVVKNVKGVKVETILTESELNVQDGQAIEFISGGDQVSERFLKEQILGDRYYYPNIYEEDGRWGHAPLDISKKDKVKVPAIISLQDRNEDRKGRLIFGQISPTEQTESSFIRYMAKDKNKNPGRIIVYDDDPEQWKALETADPPSGTTIMKKTEVTFDRSVNVTSSSPGDRQLIYFTTDGTAPSRESMLYNYNNLYYNAPAEKIFKPIIDGDKDVTIKAIVTGYGKEDSPVATFTYKHVPKPSVPSKWKASKKSYNSVSLKWSKVKDSNGYEVYRSTKQKSGFTLCKRFSTPDVEGWTNTGLKTGTTYYYKIRSYKTVSDQRKYSDYSGVTSNKPILTKAYISRITVKGKAITIKWKKVPGASGYQIYRATKSSGKYKLIKTTKGNSTLKYTNKKLKKKKMYYYKIRAYRTVSGKKVYGGFSTAKKIRIK